jgi:hypothetical protein
MRIEEFHSKGIRVAKGIFVTCAHSVSEQVTESMDPIYKHFRREKICVEGKLANLLLIGSATPWNQDIALLEAQDDWAGLDLGSVAAVKTKVLERYRVTSLITFSEFRVYFLCSPLGRISFYRAIDFRVMFSLD